MKHSTAAPLAAAAVLAGCSSIAVRNPLPAGHPEPVMLDYCVKSTAEMNIMDKTLSTDENKQRFRHNVDAAIADVDRYLQAHAAPSPFVKLQPCPRCTVPAEEHGSATGLYLTVDLSGYGSIKKKWKRVLIGSGVVEGVVEGIAVESATQNPWLAIGVAAEEIGQEYLTWNGVDWLLGETYAPVTLEGRLVYLESGKTVWQDSDFVSENEDALDKKDRHDKAKQLEASLHKAEKELISGFNEYLSEQIVKPAGNEVRRE